MADPPVPDYLRRVYTWAYLSRSMVPWLDSSLVVQAILWGNADRLIAAAFDEIPVGSSVLQTACVYGRFSKALADHLGPDGRLEVVDVAPIQVEHVARKLADRPWATARLADARDPGPGIYDAVCCFFLLHEVPMQAKRAVVDAVLDRVRPGGRAVFVDYHRPRPWHPMRPVMAGVFATLEPFAGELLDTPIRSLSGRAEAFVWRESNYFGGLYQKVVAERPLDPPPAP